MKNITLIINTYNEEKIIEKLLEKVKWTDTIIVDMHSSDLTIKITQKYTNKIYFSKKYPFVELSRNFGISKVKSNWILILDADDLFEAWLLLP